MTAPIPNPIDIHDRETAKSVHRVMMSSYRIEAELLGIEDFKPLRRSVDEIVGSQNLFLGLRVEGDLGAVAEVDLSATKVDLCSLVVDPEYFRRGLARRLLQHIIRSYPDRAITVSTGAANEPALSLYRQSGFGNEESWTHPEGIPMKTLTRSPGPVELGA